MKRLKSLGKVIIVPGGSHWNCIQCNRELQPGEKVVKVGNKRYCTKCVQGENK